jgi:hypothetical protein
MKRRLLLSLFALGLFAQVNAAETTIARTFFLPRSQGSNYARELAGVTHFMVPCDCDCLNGFLAITPEYTRSFDRDEIGKYFGFNGTNCLSVGPAAAQGVDIFARNLFLNDEFQGNLTILPRVENFIVDFRFRLNLDEWICGLYFDVYGPIAWTKFDLGLKQCIVTTGSTIEQFALGNVGTDDAAPNNSIIEALNGQNLNVTTFPNLKQSLKRGRVDGSQTKTGLADIVVALGKNFCNECMHIGFDVRGIFPTGNRPDAEFLFEPIVGNGKHFELGGGLSAHYELWNNNCDSSMSIWAEGHAYHMFKARQRRIFDLVQTGTSLPRTNTGCADGMCQRQNIGSHRLLIKKFTGSPANPSLQEVLYGPNVLARELKVKNDLHAEVVVLFDYQRCGFTFDFGYNFWARTKDKISNIEELEPNTYAIQGGTSGTSGATPNCSDSSARINGLFGSAECPPVFLTTCDLSVCSVTQPTAFSHKIFAHSGYAWCSCDYTPFIGIGGELEFSGKDNNALDQWGIWVKGGFAFI